ncbi:hypothetical protein RUM43_000744 [Polyplax serrata]|uniref:Uncharacterized protein n=1 Tax=Polyplax serrata TaxID=468196 RepID=A0AAN8SD81_POLSC
MAVARVPSPPPQEGNTPVAESWCYTQDPSCEKYCSSIYTNGSPGKQKLVFLLYAKNANEEDYLSAVHLNRSIRAFQKASKSSGCEMKYPDVRETACRSWHVATKYRMELERSSAHT